MRWGIGAALLLLWPLLAGCARVAAVQDVHDHALPAAALPLAPEQVARGMADAAVLARWHVDQSAPGRLRATYQRGSHDATVDVTWTQRDYSIVLVTSHNLREEGGEIHRSYNKWVNALEQAIDSGAAFTGPAIQPNAANAAGAVPSGPVAFGDAVPFRCPSRGTEIQFRSGAKRRFLGDDSGIACRYEDGGGVRRATAFGQYDADAEQALARLWPLKVGNRVTLAVAGGQSFRHETFRVDRHVPVIVRAGTFDAFLIDWKAEAVGYSETGAFWYAPELSAVIKIQHKLTGGVSARLADDEAVSVTRGE